MENVGVALAGTEVLRDVTLSARRGGLLVLFGPAGAGKTTLLRLCRGALRPQAGSVRVLGQPVPYGRANALAALRRQIGFLERDEGLLDHLCLRDNVAVPLLAAGVRPAAREGDVAALLNWVGIAERAGARPAMVPAALRRRAALARAVVGGAELLLADEPTDGLGRDEARALLDLVVELNAAGRTVLLASARPEVVDALEAAAPIDLAHLDGGRVACPA